MAPSKETSCEAHLPIETPSDIQAIVGLLKRMSIADTSTIPAASSQTAGSPSVVENEAGSEDHEPDVEGGSGISNEPKAHGLEQTGDAESVQETINILMNGDMAYLLLSEPVTSQSPIPPMVSAPIPAAPRPFSRYTPQTTAEIALLAALCESEACEQLLRKRCAELQALNILNELYCGKLRGQLAHQEKTKEKGKGKGRLMGDGLPCMLTGDEFYKKVVVHEADQKRAAKTKANRAQVQAGMAEAIAKWKKDEKERKERNVVRGDVYKTAVKQWETARDAAKTANKSFTTRKPGREKLETPVPRLKAGDVAEGSDSEQDEDKEGEDDDEDEDE